MKKIVALLAVVLLPFLASAYQLEEEYANMAQELSNNVQLTCEKDQAETAATNVEKIKEIINNAIENWDTSVHCPGESYPYTTSSFKRYFNTQKIKNNLKANNLDTVLKNDTQLLDEIAAYVVKIWPDRNDFETLLTIGVSPIEAAIRVKNDEYIESALDGEIVYTHYYLEPANSPCTGFHAEKVDSSINVNTSEEEINAIKAKLEAKNRNNNTSLNNPELREVGQGFAQIENSGSY